MRQRKHGGVDAGRLHAAIRHQHVHEHINLRDTSSAQDCMTGVSLLFTRKKHTGCTPALAGEGTGPR